MSQTRSTQSGRGRIRKRHSKLRKLVLWLQAAVCLAFAVGIGGIVGVFISVSRDLPKVTGYSPPEATKIMSSDGVVLATFGEQNREFVSLKQIPDNLEKATVAIEDRRFFEHSGVDFRGVARAIFVNIAGGHMAQGGSTITQQLARNVYLTPKKALSRKAREAVLAVMIERNYTKQRILELYLNQVYYGSSAFGVQAASKIYFGKDVKDLTLAECAMLAGLPQRPTYNSPHESLKDAVDRRDVVLNTMESLQMITPEEADAAKAEVPRIVKLKPARFRSKAPYFTQYVKNYLHDKLDYNDDLIYRGGLIVHTSMNYQMQMAAEKALVKGITQARKSRQIDSVQGNGALISIEANTGYIRAMVGGIDFESKTGGQFNRAVQAYRQPGSSFKIFVYCAAAEKLGWDENHIIEGGTFTYSVPGQPVWKPRNYDNKVHGSMSMRQAVARSVNIHAIRTALAAGLPSVIDYAHAMGITSEIEAYPSLAIGGVKGIHPIEMAAAYNVLASNGHYVEPTPVIKVTDSHGQLLDQIQPDPKPVLSERTVKVVDQCLRDVVVGRGGTGYAVQSIPEARGKTGTTNGDVDAWFIGYVPDKMVTAVWAGNDNHTSMRNVWGGNVCAPVWKEYMQGALKVYAKYKPNETTLKPKPEVVKTEPVKPTSVDDNWRNKKTEEDSDNSQYTESNKDDTEDRETTEDSATGTVRVKVCDESRHLATRWCPSWHVVSFVKGDEPTTNCSIHGPRGRTRTGSGTGVEPTDLRLTPPPPIIPDR